MAFQRIMMVKFAWLKYYQRQRGDIPYGDIVYFNEEETLRSFANIAENSAFINCDGKCLGYFQTKGRSPRIEKIKGQMKNLNCKSVDNVLVIFCAPNPERNPKETISIVGWYKNATVYREGKRNEKFNLYYNICADFENCVLLPEDERNNNEIWFLNQSSESLVHFGQASLYKFPPATAPELQSVFAKIENYDGENWCGKFFEVN